MRLDEFQKLTEALDHQVGLGLDQQAHFQSLGNLDAGHQLFVEDVGRFAPGLTRGERAARLGLQVLGPHLLGQQQGALGVLAAYGAIVRVGLDP